MPTRRSRAAAPDHTRIQHLSELEGVVLGIAHRDGPCTAYEIRRLLAVSPSTQWSGSAGAVYPSVRKLSRLGLLRTVAHPVRAKGTRYIATPKGVDALRAWIGPPFDDVVRTVAHDPLRSRAALLGVLTAAERRAWVAAALALLDDVEAMVSQWADARAGDPASDLLSVAGRTDVAARRAWLRKAIQILDHDTQPPRETP